MRINLSFSRVVAFVCVLDGSQAIALGAAAYFQGLGDLPGGRYSSTATAVSGNGLVVVGSAQSTSGTEAFYWTATQGMIGLGDLPGGTFNSVANDVSVDGSVIVGTASVGLPTDRDTEAFIWTANNGMVGLGDLSGGYHRSSACGVSADGSVVVGTGNVSTVSYSSQAFHWTADDGMVSIGFPLFPNFPEQAGFSNGLAVSADGTTIVGRSNYIPFYDLAAKAFRWTEATDFMILGGLPSEVHSPSSWAIDVSADGSVVIGNSSSHDYNSSRPVSESFYWTAEEGVVGLGFIYDSYFHFAFDNYATAVSADGSVVVGTSNTDLFESDMYQAYIWSADESMRFLQDVLTDDFGLDLAGWTLTEATGISDDGLTIVGNGVNPDGNMEAFIVHLPEPGSLMVLGAGVIAVLTRRR